MSPFPMGGGRYSRAPRWHNIFLPPRDRREFRSVASGRESSEMPDGTRLRLLFATVGGWVNRQQAQVIDYLVEENRVLTMNSTKK